MSRWSGEAVGVKIGNCRGWYGFTDEFQMRVGGFRGCPRDPVPGLNYDILDGAGW